MINRSESVASPCVRVCQLDGTDLCTGCGRIIDEIARWPRMSDDERRLVVLRAAQRLCPGAATA